jgi:hypothetical protein
MKQTGQNKRTMQVAIVIGLLLFLLTSENISAQDSLSATPCEIIIDDFTNGMKEEWKSRSFKGTTEYTWVTEEDKAYIRATSKASASGLYYRIEYDIQQYPFITWKWRVDNIIASGDALRKSGDDYAARIYIVFPSFFFWDTEAINYIWANKLPKEEAVPNPFSKNSIMISVQSGKAETGKWIVETRNVYEDYRRVFGKEPPKAGAIAIMTDTDNTGESASADYGSIAICSRDPRQ